MVIVIGAGYWGSAITYVLRNSGIPVLLIDDKDPEAGSRNAAGVTAPGVYKTDKVRSLFPANWLQSEITESIEWAKTVGLGQVRRGNFLNATRRDTHSRLSKEEPNIYFPPGAIISLQQPFVRRVTSIQKGDNLWEILTDTEMFQATHLVVAAGYRTDTLLHMAGLPALGVQKMYGRGVVGTGKFSHPLPLYVMTRPYTKIGVRDWGSSFYVGATAEVTPRIKNRHDLDAFAAHYIEGFVSQYYMEGYRPILSKFTVEEVAPRFIVATGGNRFGLGLSGLVAQRVKWMIA